MQSYVLRVEVMKRPTSTSVYDWKVKVEKVLEGLIGANGIDLSIDKRDVAVMESTGRRIQIFRVNGTYIGK